MAANSLGTRHWAYAVALRNLGLYYDAIEGDAARADELFAQARTVLAGNDLPLAEGFYWLGIFHHQVGRNAGRAQAVLREALVIQRRVLDRDDARLADTLIALAEATAATGEVNAAIVLMQEALDVQRAQTPPSEEAVAKTEDRLAMFQGIASIGEDDG